MERPASIEEREHADSGTAEAPLSLPLNVTLGAEHYLRTEPSWEEAGGPTASVHVAVEGARVVVEIVAYTGAVVAPDGDDNPLDNERAQVNADGVQWYWGVADGRWRQAALCTPAGGSLNMARLVPGEWPLPDAELTVLPNERGWRVRFEWQLHALPVEADGTICFDLVVNERPPDRVRRRGQLVLTERVPTSPSSAAYAYLRGDRRSPAQALRLRLRPQLSGP